MKRHRKNKNERIKIILDTNFLIDLFRFKIGFDEIEDTVGCNCVFLMVKQSINELNGIKNKYAMLGLKFVECRKIRVLETVGKNADEVILRFFEKTKFRENKEKSNLKNAQDLKNFIVATNDAKLRKKIKDTGTRTIYLRARKHLELR